MLYPSGCADDDDGKDDDDDVNNEDERPLLGELCPRT